jgi:hypothetical protein
MEWKAVREMGVVVSSRWSWCGGWLGHETAFHVAFP